MTRRIDIDTNMWDQPESVRLGIELKDDDAWRYIIKLQAWLIDSGSVDGIIYLPVKRLAEICGYRRRATKLLDAMVASGWLLDIGDGRYELKGHRERYAAYFRKIEKMRTNRAGGRTKTQKAHTDRTVNEKGQKKDSTMEESVQHACSTDAASSCLLPLASCNKTKSICGAERSTSGPNASCNKSDTPLDTKPDAKSTKSARVQHEKYTEDVLAVYEHYRKYHPESHPKPSSLSKEWRKIVARLKENHTVSDLKKAIDGCHKSPFHCGLEPSNLGKKYQNLELIVRDSSHVCQFLDLDNQYSDMPNCNNVGHSRPSFFGGKSGKVDLRNI